jgi:SAM-dependent methyltransferase
MFDLFESMFFRERSTQAEYFDTPGLSPVQREEAYRELDRLNDFFHLSHTFVSQLPRWLGKRRCENLRILDVGAGSGRLGKRLSDWARRRNWNWQFTNLDFYPDGQTAANGATFVTGSALDLPFADNSFDLVIASQMTHHLTDTDVVQHWREAWRVTRDALFICDLHRNVCFYSMLWVFLLLLCRDRRLRADGLISVKRGFRRREWRALAAQADLPDAKVWLYYGTRIVLQARKAGR